MSVASLSVRTSAGTSAAAAWEIFTNSTTEAYLLEIGLFLNAATASVYGLGFPAAIGVTPTAPVLFLREGSRTALVAASFQSALAWGTGPTVPANFYRRVSLPATIGTGVIWTFPKGLYIPVSGSVVLWNITTNSVIDAYAVVDVS